MLYFHYIWTLDIDVVSFTLFSLKLLCGTLLAQSKKLLLQQRIVRNSIFFSLSSKNGIVIINLVTKIPDNKCTSKGVFPSLWFCCMQAHTRISINTYLSASVLVYVVVLGVTPKAFII